MFLYSLWVVWVKVRDIFKSPSAEGKDPTECQKEGHVPQFPRQQASEQESLCLSIPIAVLGLFIYRKCTGRPLIAYNLGHKNFTPHIDCHLNSEVCNWHKKKFSPVPFSVDAVNFWCVLLGGCMCYHLKTFWNVEAMTPGVRAVKGHVWVSLGRSSLAKAWYNFWLVHIFFTQPCVKSSLLIYPERRLTLFCRRCCNN